MYGIACATTGIRYGMTTTLSPNMVQAVEVRQADGSYVPLDLNAQYNLITHSWIATGGYSSAPQKIAWVGVLIGHASGAPLCLGFLCLGF